MSTQNPFNNKASSIDHEMIDNYVRIGRSLHSHAIRDAFRALALAFKGLTAPREKGFGQHRSA